MSDSDEDEAVEKQLRIVFLGDKYVGKSSIIRRFCCNEYLRSYTATVGAEFYLKRMTLPARREAVLRITDVSSDEQNGAMLDKYLFNANAILLVYDITNKHSFEGLHSWVKEVHRQIRCPPIVAIIGNKSDLEHQRTVSRQSVSGLAREMNVLSYTMSAKTGEAVSLFFLDLVTKYLGIPLTRADKEHQMQVIKAELVKEEEPKKSTGESHVNRNTSVCSIQ